jgi:DNA-directed RNA polymerase specialized sigma subunit
MPTREIPRDMLDTVQTARTLEQRGRDQLKQSGDMMRDTAKQLAADGWTQIEIGAALGVSKQRVSQLVNPPKKTSPGK